MSQPSSALPFRPGSFSDIMGIVIDESGQGWVRVRMTVQPYHLQSDNIVHGGVIMTLADAAFGRAVTTTLVPGQVAVTLELKVNFMRPGMGGELVAEGRVLYRGRRLIVGEAEVKDTQGNLLAKALGTYVTIEQGQGSGG